MKMKTIKRKKEHNMHACCSNCYVDHCLRKYLVSLIVLCAHISLCLSIVLDVAHFHFVDVYLYLCHKDIPIFAMLKCSTLLKL